ncbi:hypothetical protein N7466_003482 [Penicillium verhagenii]|uniref:uncharacterized protein n=1 Tax=Penicillium verhagenii TaxID=1562060 RepID=UPI002544EF30|nr:uncharacterized protein N7466_003482 [Penicillium verhagenii]KAJ5937032.1 hypothetical protein N7466_003482 [Penicillium verhagenii]
MPETPIIIIGAGISGLILAQHLQSQGIPFEIFDSDSAFDARNGGWGLTLHWALPALRQLLPEYLVARLPETFVNKDAAARGDMGRFQFFDLKSGQALYDVPAEERIRVNRGRMRELLTCGLKIQWNKKFVNIESSEKSIIAHFDDGSSCTGCLLVAADGARSRARQILYPQGYAMNQLPVQLLGASALYTQEQLGGVETIDPYIFQGSHPDTDVFMFFSFLDTPSNFNESSRNQYHCQIVVSWADKKGILLPSTNSDRMALMRQLTDNWAEPFRSLVYNLPEETEARSIRVDDWIFQPGQSDEYPRVILVGDAAHTMTMLVRGEGANNAIVDVLDLVEKVDLGNISALSSADLALSRAAYEDQIFSRVEPSVLASRQACLDAHDFSQIKGSPLVTPRIWKSRSDLK